jgi:hypothetical protein
VADPRGGGPETGAQRTQLRCCNGTYTRSATGWIYPWGAPVPGAVDLTVADMLAIDGELDIGQGLARFRALSPDERRWLAGDDDVLEQVLLRRRAGARPDAGDLIVGMLAPELHVQTMLTVGDIAETAGVSKATVDSYRHRGYLPTPQVTRGRTPLWARPIVHRWLRTRPGPGWRRDLYEPETRRRPDSAGSAASSSTGPAGSATGSTGRGGSRINRAARS